MTPKVNNSTNVPTPKTTAQPKRVEQYKVKQGDTISVLAKNMGLTVTQFQALTGVTSLKTGTVLKFKMDEVPSHKGIMALAQKYNMDFTEFCKLNKIPAPYREYSPKKGEKFYIINGLGNSANKTQSSKPTPKSAPAKPAQTKPKRVAQTSHKSVKTKPRTSMTEAEKVIHTTAAAGAKVISNVLTWGSRYSPAEIAQGLNKSAKDHWGAVEKADFQEMLKQINPKNASAVIKAYKKISPNESLINTITSEIRSSKDARKNAVMYIYDSLAQEKKYTQSARAKFKANLDKEFDKWVGMVDTSQMDKTIDSMLAKTSSTQATNSSKKSTKVPHNGAVVKLTKSEKTFTVSDLQRGAIASGKKEAIEKFKEYCKANNIQYDENMLDLAPIERYPAPVVKNGKVVSAETALLRPTSKPNGKVVVLNPGHGGYSSRNGCFDPGSYSFIKKGNGKYAPLLEYAKMKEYSDDLTEKLRAQGYAVVIAGGHAQTMSDQNTITNVISKLNSGQKGGQKYSKSNIVLISLHADSQPGSSGSGVCYDSKFADDTKLQACLNKNLNQDDWIKSAPSERRWGEKGIQVLHQSEQNPSVLLEVEYVNGNKSQNLDSRDYRTRYTNKIVAGLNEYFKK